MNAAIKNLKVVNENGTPVLQIMTEEGLIKIELTNGFRINEANEILRSITDKYYIFFKNFNQYIELVELVNAEIKGNTAI